MPPQDDQLRRIGLLFAFVRLGAVPLAIVQVLLTDFPPHYKPWAWGACALLAVGAVTALYFTRKPLSPQRRERVAESALVFDTALAFVFIFLYAFVDGQPLWALYYVPILEAALRFGTIGGLLTPIATAPLLVAAEEWRSARFAPSSVRIDAVGVRIALGLVIGAVVGQLVRALVSESGRAAARAEEAEKLRDELGRRVDLLESANRCARALSSSLELDQAFSAFIRELRGLVPFDRMTIVLVDAGMAEVIATAGAGAETLFPPGSRRPVAGSVLDDVLDGRTIVRDDIRVARYPEEEELAALGLRSRLVTPLLVGARPIGMIAIQRAEPDAFSTEDVELVSLLGRLVATAVQNIRAYEGERRTAEELRRLSALRADFVSLVSHELRSPMAAVIGSARTLQTRWRELSPGQRESFLALIADETSRLAALIADVLDTSRIEAGTFSFTFSEVDVAELVRDSVAAAEIGQDEVLVSSNVASTLPAVRGDRQRLRQVLVNLIDNAVKYSRAGGEVAVNAYSENGAVRVDVRDEGPGIPRDQQKIIFEKFGRAGGTGKTRPGTGLGLFIARSIAEAHGGALTVRSAPGQGSTFTLTLPGDADA